MMNVVYHNRALPLGWSVFAGSKGHRSEEEHLALLKSVQAMVPGGRAVIFLGDGEFDGIGLLSAVQTLGWQYVCRTAKNVRLEVELRCGKATSRLRRFPWPICWLPLAT